MRFFFIAAFSLLFNFGLAFAFQSEGVSPGVYIPICALAGMAIGLIGSSL